MGVVARAPLRAVVRPAEVPLSFAQRRLWFLERLEGGRAGYTIPLAVRLSGYLDVGALEAALGDVVERHESLRTVFPERDGVARQLILDVSLARPRLSVMCGERRGAWRGADGSGASCGLILSAIRRFVRIYLCLVRASMCFCLCCTTSRRTVGRWVLCGGIFRVSYSARCAGEVSPLSPLAVQYADYTLWQHAVLGDESDADSVLGRSLSFWREELAGLPEQIALPFDRARPAVLSYRGGSVELRLSARLHGELLRLARAVGRAFSWCCRLGLRRC